MTPMDFQSWSDAVLARVESALSDWVPAVAPAGLGEAMRYGVLDGGKRLRALLVQAAAEATGACGEAVGVEEALRAAAAVDGIRADRRQPVAQRLGLIRTGLSRADVPPPR